MSQLGEGNKRRNKIDMTSYCREGNGTHSSTLAWKILWTEEPGRLQSMESRRVGHDWATSLSLSTFMHWRRKWQPTPVFFLENPRDGGAWWAAIYEVAQSRAQLKWLSSSRPLFEHWIFHRFHMCSVGTFQIIYSEFSVIGQKEQDCIEIHYIKVWGT